MLKPFTLIINTDGAYRLEEGQADMPGIPIHPIGYGDAAQLLRFVYSFNEMDFNSEEKLPSHFEAQQLAFETKVPNVVCSLRTSTTIQNVLMQKRSIIILLFPTDNDCSNNFRLLRGNEAPESWQGALELNYRTGPGFVNSSL